MARISTVSLGLLGSLVLAACNSTTSGGATGGSSSGGSNVVQTIGEVIGNSGLSAAEYADAYATLSQLIDDFQPTQISDLPSGTADYAGIVTLTLPNGGGTVLGDLSLDVDFGAQTFEGGVQDFFDTNLAAVSGALDIFDGTLSGSDLSADADGTVAGEDLDYTVTGEFLGSGASAVDLLFAGTGSGGVGLAEKH
jgi:predicted small secreted protein